MVGVAAVTVFVDDAVRGRLPGVCAKDGVPTSATLRVVEEVGQSNRLGVLWLLVFLGPLGWIALALLAGRDRGEHLAVELPWSEEAYDRLVEARRARSRALAAGAAAGAGLLALLWRGTLGPAGGVLFLAVVVATLGAALVTGWRIGTNSVGVQLDASRRWVTLTGVHPDFAAACRHQAAAPEHHRA